MMIGLMKDLMRWVADLSFNQIEKIENLSALTRLVDLSLYNNKITTFEGLDALEDLKSLSLGNNQFKELEKVCQKNQHISNLHTIPCIVIQLSLCSTMKLAIFLVGQKRIKM